MSICTVENCSNKYLAKGLCNKHYLRKKNHGDTSVILKNGRHFKYLTEKDYIESSYIKDEKTGCWIWKRSRRGDYGQVNWRNFHISAHRFVYMQYKGEIPVGMCICHKCDTRLCVNPEHLFLGTHKENMRDMVDKKRQSKGSDCHLSKLNELDVIKIKKLINSGLSCSEVARQYNMHSSTIIDIKNGKIWRDIA